MPSDPLNLFVVPTVLSLLALFIAAAFYDLTVFRRRKNRNKTVYRCEACRSIYESPFRTPLARCPRCGRLNEQAIKDQVKRR